MLYHFVYFHIGTKSPLRHRAHLSTNAFTASVSLHSSNSFNCFVLGLNFAPFSKDSKQTQSFNP